MMNLINMNIKNFIAVRLILIISFFLSFIMANNELHKKEKSIESIDLEIEKLEVELEKQITQQKKSEEKIKKLKEEIRIEKKTRINTENKKNIKDKTLKRSNIILDSLTKDLNNNSQFNTAISLQ